MIAASLADPGDFEEWRAEARRLVAMGVAPQDAAWPDGTGSSDLFAQAPRPVANTAGAFPREVRASRAFMDTARHAILHRDPARLAVLYRVLWRLQERPHLLADAADPDIVTLERLALQVRRDMHKMRAFVRFRAVRDGADTDGDGNGGERFVAWFEPDHRIERANAGFFVSRFASQRWSILTPALSLHWDGETLMEGPPASRLDAPTGDAAEALWLGYYRSTFNPARLKVGMMMKEMPRRYWKNLPEARQISELVAGAQSREAAMIATGATRFENAPPTSLAAIAEGIGTCRRCAIGCNGTRAVSGEGPSPADLMIVGEQPGDTEEREGRAFIGPAGQILDAALAQAGISRTTAYTTNAVKHFRHDRRAGQRLHRTPSAQEIDLCRWWLDAERALVKPKVILALGASSARGLLGRTPSIGRERGQAMVSADGTSIWLTAHPSYLLRLDGEARGREQARFAADLAGLASFLARDTPPETDLTGTAGP